MDKPSLKDCDHSENHLNEEGNNVFTLNGRIKGKFVSKVVNLSKRKRTGENFIIVQKIEMCYYQQPYQ